MFTKLKQKVKEETTLDTNIPSISSNNNQNSVKQASFKDSSSEAANNSSSEDGNTSSKINSNESNKKDFEKNKSIDYDTENRQLFDSDSISSEKYQLSISNVNSNLELFENQSNLNQNIHESNIKLELKKLNESLLKQVEDLTNELNEKQNENESLRIQLNKINIQFEDNQYELDQYKLEISDYKSIILNYEKEIKELNKDKDELIIRNAELSEKYELLKLVNMKQQAKTSNEYSSKSNNDEAEHSKLGLNGILASSHINLEQMDESKSLRDELNEKNKVIKNLQQRINDMKKTLQKELKYQALPNEQLKLKNVDSQQQFSPIKSNFSENLNNNNTSMPSTPTTTNSNNFSVLNNKQEATNVRKSSPTSQHNSLSRKISASAHTTSLNQTRKYSITNGTSSVTNTMNYLEEDVNFKYLKHVVLKFLTSKEYEALHLVKALSVLLHFTNEEERILKESLQYKMSWFGTRPKTGKLL